MSKDAFMNELVGSIEYTKRSEPVDYNVVKTKSIALLEKEWAVTWGVSLNLESLKKKDGRSVSIKGKTMTYDQLLSALLSQGSQAMKEGIADPSKRIETDKKTVTVGRLAKAFARETIYYVEKKPSANPFAQMAAKSNKSSGTNLPKKFSFLNAPYGMTEDELTANYDGLMAFYTAFDVMIESAVENGWQRDENGKIIESTSKTSSARRSWAENFKEFMDFNGYEHTSKELTK